MLKWLKTKLKEGRTLKTEIEEASAQAKVLDINDAKDKIEKMLLENKGPFQPTSVETMREELISLLDDLTADFLRKYGSVVYIDSSELLVSLSELAHSTLVPGFIKIGFDYGGHIELSTKQGERSLYCVSNDVAYPDDLIEDTFPSIYNYLYYESLLVSD